MAASSYAMAVFAAVAACAGSAWAAQPERAVYHPGPPDRVAGYLILDKTPIAPPTREEVKRVQACKDEAIRANPALDAPGGAVQVSKLINQCLGTASAVFTLPWQGNTPINTYLN